MEKKNLLLWLAAIILSNAMLSCASSDDDVESGEVKKVVNMLTESEPIVLTQEQQRFANDNNGFTLNFLKTVNETDRSGKSFIYSPLSITYVLGMVNDAATGETERELEQILGFHEGGIQAVNDYCKKLIEGLPKVDNKVTLNIANALFVNKNKDKLKAQYQQDMQTYYDAKAENLDFNAPTTLSTINGWASDHTNGMIPKILDEINPEVVTYLLNAIYFKADWTTKFDPKSTKTETFTPEDGATVQLPLMHQNVLISYRKNDYYEAVEIPYGNGYWKMTVILPVEGKSIDEVINLLAQRGPYAKIYTGGEGKMFAPYEVDLKLPRFETNSDTNDIPIGLKGLLQKMGIQRAFNSYLADIPNMCERPVYIGMMLQKAAIKVNEEGSEAAAVTAAAMDNTCMGPAEYPKATFHANHPFVYCITESSSGVILFVGKFTGR